MFHDFALKSEVFNFFLRFFNHHLFKEEKTFLAIFQNCHFSSFCPECRFFVNVNKYQIKIISVVNLNKKILVKNCLLFPPLFLERCMLIFSHHMTFQFKQILLLSTVCSFFLYNCLVFLQIDFILFINENSEVKYIL